MPPHIDARPPIAANIDTQRELFLAIDANDHDRAMDIARRHQEILEAHFSLDSSDADTPLSFALKNKRYQIALGFLLNFSMAKLNPWHVDDGKNAIDRLLALKKTDDSDLYDWLRDFISSAPSDEINYLLADEHTRHALLAHRKIASLLKNRDDIKTDESPKVKNGVVPIGINNSGNSCYANSVMQLLMRMSDRYWAEAKATYINSRKNSFVDAILDFRSTWLSANRSEASLSEKLRTIINVGIDTGVYDTFGNGSSGKNKYYRQEDAQEFLTKMTDFLSKTQYKSFSEINVIEYDVKGKPRKKLSAPESVASGIGPSLHGVKNRITLQDLLSDYFEREHLTGDNQYVASELSPPNNRVDAYRTARLYGDSDYLLVHFKRFQYDLSKINTPVDLGDGIVDLANFMEPVSKQKRLFKIVAISMHSGSAQGGHYTARVLYGDQWYEANDSSVTKTNWDAFKEIAERQSYILLLQDITN